MSFLIIWLLVGLIVSACLIQPMIDKKTISFNREEPADYIVLFLLCGIISVIWPLPVFLLLRDRIK